MTPVLVAEGLHKRYATARSVLGRPTRQVDAVRDVSLHVSEAETLGLVGESGSGKSTTARLLTCLERPDRGTVQIDGCELVSLSHRRLRAERRKIQMVFQDPYASLDPTKMIVHAIGEPLWLHEHLRGAARDARVRHLLEQVGLTEAHMHRYPYEFSGGQRQRVAIARALAPSPKVVIADEAVSALDVSTQAQVLNLLRELRDAHGLAMVFISHDLSVVRQVADRIAIMYLGAVVESGPSAEVYGEARHPYTRALLSAVPELAPARRRQRIRLPGDPAGAMAIGAGCGFASRCPDAMPMCREVPPPVRDVGGVSVACHLYDTVATPVAAQRL